MSPSEGLNIFTIRTRTHIQRILNFVITLDKPYDRKIQKPVTKRIIRSSRFRILHVITECGPICTASLLFFLNDTFFLSYDSFALFFFFFLQFLFYGMLCEKRMCLCSHQNLCVHGGKRGHLINMFAQNYGFLLVSMVHGCP